jgi:hypothetical protein
MKPWHPNENSHCGKSPSSCGLVRQEGTTAVWFSLQLGPSTFGAFDAFVDEAGRQAHLNGPIAQALGQTRPSFWRRSRRSNASTYSAPSCLAEAGL